MLRGLQRGVRDTPVIIVGDCNIVMNPALEAEPGFSERFGDITAEWNELLDEAELLDAFRVQYPASKCFSFAPLGANAKGIFRRLDYGFVSVEHNHLVQGVDYEVNSISDHKSLGIRLRFKPVKRGKGLWRAKDSTFQNEDVLGRLKEEALNIAELSETFVEWGAQQKWEWIKWRLGVAIRAIEKENKKVMIQAEADLKKWLSTEESKSNPDPGVIMRIMGELKELEEARLQELILKSRVKWADNNEKCTKFFFDRIKHNAAESNVVRLKEGDRELSDEEVDSTIRNYYSELYKHRPVIDAETWRPPAGVKIGENRMANLTRPFGEGEFETILFKKLNQGKSSLQRRPYRVSLQETVERAKGASGS